MARTKHTRPGHGPGHGPGRLLGAALAGATLLVWPAAAWAAAAPATPVLSKSQPIILGYFFMFLLAAVVVAISLMPSKRSHQD